MLGGIDVKEHRRPGQQSGSGDTASAVIVLGTLLTAAAVGGWYLLPPVKRLEIEFIFWTKNSGAVVTSASSIVAFFVLLALASKKKSRFLTTAVADAHDDLGRSDLEKANRRLIKLPYLLGAGAGLIAYAYCYVSGLTRWLFFAWLARKDLAVARGVLIILTTALPTLLIPVYVVVLLNATGLGRAWRSAVLTGAERRKKELPVRPLPDPGPYQAGNEWPSFLLGAREFEESRKFEPDTQIPSWVKFEAPSVFGGLLVFGRKGSGKTQCLLRMIDDALQFPGGLDEDDVADRKAALCIIDQKGDITDHVLKKAKEVGREGDVTRLGVDTFPKWNPFAVLGPTSSAVECRNVGFFMRCAMTAGQKSTTENGFWQDNADNLLFRTVHLLALAGESVGFESVYRVITSLDAQDKFRDELLNRAEAGLNARETLGADVADARLELGHTERYFEKEFVKLDAKIKTTVTNIVSNFAQKFMTAAYIRSFGCSADTPGHITGFRDLIARGGIFVLDVRSNEHGTLASALAMLVKLYYQAAVKTRDKNPADKMERATVLVLDEAQSCLSPSTQNTEGDDKYLETSRSFRAIDIYATQQYTSFSAAIGQEMAQRIIGSFNNLLVFRHQDPALTKFLQENTGSDEREEKSVSVSESASSAGVNVLAVDGETERDRQVSRSVSLAKKERLLIDAATFRKMGVFEALGFFDEPEGLRITRFFTKPQFTAATTPHSKVLELVKAKKRAERTDGVLSRVFPRAKGRNAA